MAKRNHSTCLVRRLQILTIGAFLVSPVAHPQGVTQSQIQAMQSQIQMMQGQVQTLTARVKSLEDQAQLASSSPDDAKQSKALEQRLESSLCSRAAAT